MLVLTIARKPLSGSVIVNSQEYGTGGLNIDECRVEGGKVRHLQGHKFRLPGRCLGGGVFYGNPPRETTEGRWPANIVLEHKPDCQCLGEKIVKGSYLDHDCTGGVLLNRGTAHKTGYASPDKTEIVQDWSCSPDCPVTEMDKQSFGVGIHSAGSKTGKQNPDWAKSEYHPLVFGGNLGAVSYTGRYGDTGGASRFFKQIQKK
ncbi:MAG: hypothetical protein WC824_13955 [Bacteroidota bacterium]|jgi:hypothetical protein